jgi:thioredoxin reductase (NADPH)
MPTDTADVADLAFPKLDEAELRMLGRMATTQTYDDGETIFRAGEAAIDLFVVKSGGIDILNPTNENRLIVTHQPGEFAGDIDLLTRRPVIVTARAHGPTQLLRVPSGRLHEVLNAIPRLGEKLITAFQVRREQLQRGGVLGMRVIGPGSCRDTTVVREFLHKNFVPFTWFDTEHDAGRGAWESVGSPRKTPAIECSDGRVLLNPSLQDLARCAGIWRDCPTEDVDLAVVGAGPAGLAAAVYAASEGLRTVVLDRIGPGGQVSGSSLVENFIGFPAGLSGTELATRGCLQMLKFGAKMVAPVSVERIESRAGNGGGHDLHLDCGAVLHAQVVLVATGMNWRKLEADGAQRYERAGVYYACTSVEGFLHQGQDVAVVGAGNSAGQAAMFLAERCARTVHLLVRKDTLGPGMSDYLADRIRAQRNITVHTGVQVSAVHGKEHIESADLRHADGRTSRLDVTAIFVFIGAEPGATWLPDSVARDKLGYLLTGVDALHSGRWPLTDREPTPLETTVPGILAGGDVRAGSTKRVGFAVGDGSLAVTCAHRIRGHIATEAQKP